MKTLTLTTPNTKNGAVTTSQRRLATNSYGRFYEGTIDGIFGELEAQACKDAKFALGYADKNVTPTYGDDLDAFLSGAKQLTPAMTKLRKTRADAKPLVALGQLAYNKAVTQLGVKESPANSNIVLYS